MATLQQALTRIDAICPNAWDETAKLLWLNECESMIQTRILGTAPEQCITYDADTDRSTKLLVPAPFDRLYVYYVIAMCDYAAHETAHYADSMMLFNAALDEYAKWYQRTNGAAASTPGLVKEIAANTKARHTHKNLAVLDGITAGKMAAWNAKADRAAATQKSDGLMSAADKRKLDTVEAHAKDVDVDDTLSPVSTAAIMNKTVTAALNAKAGTAAATTSTNGLMSSADKVKLDGVEDGATKTIVDDAMSDTSTNPVQNKVVMKYIDSRGSLPPVSAKNDTMLIQVVDGAYALRTKESIFPVDDALDTESKNAVENGIIARRFEQLSGAMLPATSKRDGLMSAANYTKLSGIEAGANKTVVDAALDAGSANPVQNKAVKAALDGKAGTAVATTSTNGLMSAADKAKLDGVEAGANKTTVDAALDAASENPVQNKAVKAALDKKLSTQGGEISGNLDVGLAVGAGGSVSTGVTSTDSGIHFEKAASDAGRISHGIADVDDTVPLARLKVATPTEDDDAATKAYVDGKAAGSGAVRYDAAQELTTAQQFQARKNIGAVGDYSPQFQGFLSLAPANGTLGTGVGLSPTRDGNNYALDISDVNENSPTLLTGVKTPTDANTNAAATVEYVKAKVAGGGVTVDAALDAGSANPVQNKAVKAALDGKAGTAVATTSVNGLMSKDDKTKLDGIASGATKITIDSTMSGSSNNPVANHVVKQYVDDKVAAAGSNITVDALLSSTSTNPVQNKAVKAALDSKLHQTTPSINGGLFYVESTETQLQVKLNDYIQSAAGEEFANLDITDVMLQPTNDQVVISGLADFGDAEAVGMENTAVSYAQLLGYTKPLTLTYANGQVTGAAYTDIRKAIERGRQIKLSVANTPDIIASNARNETNKSVVIFINTDVGGDTVNIAQYTVTAQASGVTVNVKSHELA